MCRPSGTRLVALHHPALPCRAPPVPSPPGLQPLWSTRDLFPRRLFDRKPATPPGTSVPGSSCTVPPGLQALWSPRDLFLVGCLIENKRILAILSLVALHHPALPCRASPVPSLRDCRLCGLHAIFFLVGCLIENKLHHPALPCRAPPGTVPPGLQALGSTRDLFPRGLFDRKQATPRRTRDS